MILKVADWPALISILRSASTRVAGLYEWMVKSSTLGEANDSPGYPAVVRCMTWSVEAKSQLPCDGDAVAEA